MQQESPTVTHETHGATAVPKAIWERPTFETMSIAEVTLNSEFIASIDGTTLFS